MLWLFVLIVVVLALAIALAPFLFVAVTVTVALVLLGLLALAVVLALEWFWVEAAWTFAKLRVISGRPRESFDEWLAWRREEKRWWQNVRDYRKGRRIPTR